MPLCKAITGSRLQMLPSRLDRHSQCLSWAFLVRFVSYHCLAGSILLTRVLSSAQLSLAEGLQDGSSVLISWH